ncbi:MAG: hypothetical protein GKR89_04840 [Candidatus Latescibacteria bacterium]|nr:hypothetical protein [Candidatus Latescibacterota bacterium]
MNKDRAEAFHQAHPICDMLGINLNHPRFLVDDIDLGQRQDSFRGCFPKFRQWGLSLVVCKGGVAQYSDEFAALWRQQPEWRPGRPNAEGLYLSMAVKSPTQILLAVLDRFLVNVETYPDQVLLVRSVADIERARQSGRTALLMGANRSDWFGDSPGVLRQLARLGLRMITIGQATRELGWDTSNDTRSGGRLTQLGVRMIEEMNQQGILIDLAHTNEPCALDAIEVSRHPVIDSHSAPLTLEAGDRSTSDKVLRALAAKGGMLGITPPISRPPGETPYTTIDPEQMRQTLTQIRYTADLIGPQHVGIGTHFTTALLPFVTEALLEDGFSEADTAAIMGGNYLRVLKQVLPE